VLDSGLAGALTGGGISWVFRECRGFRLPRSFCGGCCGKRELCHERVVLRLGRSVDGGWWIEADSILFPFTVSSTENRSRNDLHLGFGSADVKTYLTTDQEEDGLFPERRSLPG
jgi:hypothetical protein